jgi:hypothetical protein
VRTNLCGILCGLLCGPLSIDYFADYSLRTTLDLRTTACADYFVGYSSARTTLRTHCADYCADCAAGHSVRSRSADSVGSAHLCTPLCTCLNIAPLSLCLSVSLSLCLSVSLFGCLSVSLSLPVPVFVCLCLPRVAPCLSSGVAVQRHTWTMCGRCPLCQIVPGSTHAHIHTACVTWDITVPDSQCHRSRGAVGVGGSAGTQGWNAFPANDRLQTLATGLPFASGDGDAGYHRHGESDGQSERHGTLGIGETDRHPIRAR